MNWWYKLFSFSLILFFTGQSFALDLDRVAALQKLEPAKRIAGLFLYAQELEQELQQEQSLAKLYNLALLYVQAGEKGRAMLHLIRANRRSIGHPLITGEIQSIQNSLPVAEQSKDTLGRLKFIGLSWDRLQMFVVGFVLATTLLWVVWQQKPNTVMKCFLWFCLSGTVAFGLLLAVVLLDTYDHSQVVLLQNHSECRYGPAQSFAVKKNALPSGILAQQRSQKKGWALLEFAEGEQCWLPQRLVALP